MRQRFTFHVSSIRDQRTTSTNRIRNATRETCGPWRKLITELSDYEVLWAVIVKFYRHEKEYNLLGYVIDRHRSTICLRQSPYIRCVHKHAQIHTKHTYNLCWRHHQNCAKPKSHANLQTQYAHKSVPRVELRKNTHTHTWHSAAGHRPSLNVKSGGKWRKVLANWVLTICCVCNAKRAKNGKCPYNSLTVAYTQAVKSRACVLGLQTNINLQKKTWSIYVFVHYTVQIIELRTPKTRISVS